MQNALPYISEDAFFNKDEAVCLCISMIATKYKIEYDPIKL